MLLLLGVTNAYAAGRVLDDDFNRATFWWSMLGVQWLSLLGYAASSLPRWGRWSDGSAEERLTLVSSAISAALAGNICFYGGLYYFELSKVVCFISAIGGGFLGEKVLTPIFNKMFSNAGSSKPPGG